MGLECRKVDILKRADLDDFLNLTDALYSKDYNVFDKKEIKSRPLARLAPVSCRLIPDYHSRP